MIIDKDGQIIVTELRPMSELMLRNDYSLSVLGYLSKEKRFERIRQTSEVDVFGCDSCKFLHVSDFDGFINMPIYQPESKKTCKDCGAANLEDAKKKCLVTEFGEVCDGVKFYD